MSRTRLLKPGFFADEDLGGLSRDSRLAYAGLWTLADDAGYFDLRPRQIAFELFRYDDDREAIVESALADLVRIGNVELLECGQHGLIASMPEHVQKGGNHAFTYRDRHASCGASGPVQTRPVPVRTRAQERPAEPSSTRRVRTGPVPVPDKSPSFSVSDSPNDQEKKNGPGGGAVVGADAGRATPALQPASSVSRPVAAGRPDASPRPPEPAGFSVALPKLAPRWRVPCTNYSTHQSHHRIEDGVAICELCEAALYPATEGPGATQGLGL